MNFYGNLIQTVMNFFEVIFVFYIANEFAYYKSRKSFIGLLPWVITVFVFTQIFGYVLKNSSYTILVNLLVVLIYILLAYKDDPIRPFFGQILVNIIGLISNLFGLAIYMFITNQTMININRNQRAIIFICLVEISFLIIVYKNKRKIAFNFDKILKNKYVLFIFALVYQAIIIISVLIMLRFKYNHATNNAWGVSLLFGTLILFMLLFMIQFAKMYVNYYESKLILEELAIKNDELRKIKHDYASQISFLYALYQLNKVDKLGEMMKQIIESNNSISGTVEIYDTKNPVFISALKSATKAGIHVVVDDKVDMEILDIAINDLAKIVLNIVNNAIRALEETPSPFIKIHTTEDKDNMCVTIENNGPRIPKEILNEIFIKGFTTKNEESDEHGYGLAIVKELVEKYNGEISVRSEDIRTEFNMKFPKKGVV